MLIKYQTCVINLDKVSEYVKSNSKSIRFFFDSFDQETNQVTCSELEFYSEDDRDQAFIRILDRFEDSEKICILD